MGVARLVSGRMIGMVVAAALALHGARAVAQFDLLSWSTVEIPGYPSTVVTVNGDSLMVAGPTYPDPCFAPGADGYAVSIAPFDATVHARMAFFPDDGVSSLADVPVYVVNGVKHVLPVDCTDCEVVFHVKAGDVFGFGNHSVDCLFSASVSTWTELRLFPEPQGAVVKGSVISEAFGQAVANVGDLDFDGVADVAIGGPHGAFLGPDTGRVVVLSGADASPLFVKNGPAAGLLFGFSVAGVGDVTHDGVPDILVGAPNASFAGSQSGRFYLLSGAGGAVVFARDGDNAAAHLGYSVAGPGDLSGDGVPDLLLGSPGSHNFGEKAGRAQAINGATFAALFTVAGEAPGAQCGWAVAAAGDINGDGVPDVIVGSPFPPSNDAPVVGHARVHSGADGAVLLDLAGENAGDQFGAAVAGVGDLDGDGVPDVAVGAPTADTPYSSGGTIAAFAGANGTLLFAAHGGVTLELLGVSVAAAGDVDDDGRDDVLVGAWGHPQLSPNPSGTARVLSGRDGSLLAVFNAPQVGAFVGQAGAGLGDIDGDGHADVVVGAPGTDGPPQDTGVVTFYTHIRSLWTNLGGALSGQLGEPKLAGKSLLSAGGPFILSLQSGFPHAPLTLVAGFAQLGAPFKGGVLWPQPDLVIPGFTLDAAGAMTLAANWPAGVPSGFLLYVQAWIQEGAAPTVFSASNGLRAETP